MGNDLTLSPGPDDELNGVLFDNRHTEEPLDGDVNATFLLFKVLLMRIPHVRGLVNNFILLFGGFDDHKMIFLFNETKRQKYFK